MQHEFLPCDEIQVCDLFCINYEYRSDAEKAGWLFIKTGYHKWNAFCPACHELKKRTQNCYACSQCKNLTTRNGALWCEIKQLWVRGNSKRCEMFEDGVI